MTLADYLHPLFGAAVIALWLGTGALGLRSIGALPRRRRDSLRSHRRIAPVAAAALLLAFLSGVVAVHFGRPDLELASTAHFRLGSALVAGAALQWASARWMHVPWVRTLHPWSGALTMLLAAAQVFFGLQLTR